MTTSTEKQIGVQAIALPLVILLFWAVPWESDRRSKPIIDRFFQLKQSKWSWDQVEYHRMLESIDVNQLVDGVPLFVRLAIDTRDEAMLKKMIARGANVNSSDWGCTPMLRAVEMDNNPEGRARSESLALLLIHAGADPNLLPTPQSVERRLATGISKDECAQFDTTLKFQNVSTLRLVATVYPHSDVLSLLVQKGARLKGREDAQSFLAIVVEGWLVGSIEDHVVNMARAEGASLDEAFEKSTRWDLERHTILTDDIVRRMSPDGITRVLNYGADPNRRTPRGVLPLMSAIGKCKPVKTTVFSENDANGPLYEYVVRDWRELDKEARSDNKQIFRVVGTLLAAGANPNLPIEVDGEASSLLTYAVEQCSSDIPRLLVAYKARINGKAINAARFDLKAFLQSQVGNQ